MATILRRYAGPVPGVWYAQVLGDDGEQRELKIRAAGEPSDADFLALAEPVGEARDG